MKKIKVKGGVLGTHTDSLVTEVLKEVALEQRSGGEGASQGRQRDELSRLTEPQVKTAPCKKELQDM